MKLLSSLVLSAVLAAGCAAPAPAQEAAAKLADAKPGDVRIFAAGSVRAAVLAVQPRLEKATGHAVVIESSESRALQRQIEAGQAFEATILTTVVLDDMIQKGKIVAASKLAIGTVRVGVAVRGQAPELDVTTMDGLKKAILGAHGVRRYYGVAASTPILDNLFNKLGLTESTKDKMVPLETGKIPPENPLPPGQYELIINLASAVLPMKGWTWLGLIPEEFQMPVDHAAGIGANGNMAMGKIVMDVLRSPDFQAAIKANGMAPD